MPPKPRRATPAASARRQLAPLLLAATACITGVCAASGRQAGAASLSNVFTSLPGISEDGMGKAGTFANANGGHAGLLTFELEDDYDAVQIGVVNQYTTAWGLSRVVVAPSASYGGDPVTGQAAYDVDGTPLADMLPVQWSNGGANSAPGGNAVLALALSAPAPAGKTSLAFTTTKAASAYGGTPPAVGWAAADGLGCIPAGATVAAVTATKITLSAPTAAGCKTGQDIYFSSAAFGAFGQAIPAASAFGELSVTFSDWVPMRSLPRVDGGFSTGASVTGPAVAAGTTLVATGYTSLTLSKPLAAALPAHSALTLSAPASTAAQAPRAATTLKLANAAGVRAGYRVTGSSGLAAGTTVKAIAGNTVTLDRATTGVVPAGAALGFVNTAWTSLDAAAGDTVVAVPSTSRRPLLHVRYYTQAQAPSVHAPGCMRNPIADTLPCEAPLGLAPVWSSIGGQDTSKLPIDGVNFPRLIGGVAGAARAQASYPSFFVRYLGRHAGATVVVCGGFQSSGAAGTASGEAGPGRVGAAWASAQNPAVPVSVVSVASHALDTGPDFDNCTRMIDQMQPSMALMQNFSNHNLSQVDTYRAQLQGVAEHALSVGVQPIIYLGYVEASGHVGALPVAAAVNNSTTVPLLTGLNRSTSGATTLVTGPGIPDGTLAIPVAASWSLSLTKPVTIPAGAIISMAVQVNQTVGTSVTLAQPSFFSTNAALVTAPGVPAGTSIGLARGSYHGTLTQAAAIPAGTVLGLANDPVSSVANYTKAAQWFFGKTDPWDAVQLDGFHTLGTDSANANWLCNGCTVEGAYANDYGNSLIAAQFVPLLQRLTGQTP